MSIASFTAALKDKAYAEWYKNSTKSILIQTTSELRENEQSTSKTSFLLRGEDIVNIAEKLAGRVITPLEIDRIRNDLITSVRRNRVILRKDSALLFPVISFKDGISRILERGFQSLPKVEIVDKTTGKTREARVSDFFEKGHVFSIAANIGEQTVRNLNASKATQEVKNTLIPVLKEMVEKLKQDDIESSNVRSLDYDLYAKYAKNPYKYLVEMQPVEINQASGRASRPLTEAIRRYFNPQKYVELQKFFRTRASEDSFIQKLITTKGSPSMLEMIQNEIVSTLRTGKGLNQQTAGRVKLDKVSNKIDTSKVQKQIRQRKAEVEKAIKTLQEAVRYAESSLALQQTTDLTGLETLLRLNLPEQVKKNMGTGGSKSLLNLRSGRLAESSEIKIISATRAGMVNIYYSYMKNPYATFSEGGQQQYPRTRDPKVLISKSIRELVQPFIKDRMRAIVV